VHRLPDGVVAAKGEGDVAHAPADLDPWKTLLQLASGLDEGQRVVGVFLDTRADGQDVGVEDQVLRFESHLFGQDAIGPREDLDLALRADRLTLLVKSHHDHRCAVPADRPRLPEELVLAVLEADRVDDAFALQALHACFQDRPFRAVDHDR